MPCGCVVAAYLGLQLVSGYPRTVSFEIESWANNSWGLHNIDRHSVRGTVMIYSDGSRANKVSSTYFRHYFVSNGDLAAHTIYLRPANAMYDVDNQKRSATYHRCSCTWDEPLISESSGVLCDAVAQAHLGKARRVSQGMVASIKVVRYESSTSDAREEAAFAPDRNCELLEKVRTTYNTLTLPTSRYRFTVRSYSLGEPSHEFRFPPPGYAVKEGRRY